MRGPIARERINQLKLNGDLSNGVRLHLALTLVVHQERSANFICDSIRVPCELRYLVGHGRRGDDSDRGEAFRGFGADRVFHTRDFERVSAAIREDLDIFNRGDYILAVHFAIEHVDCLHWGAVQVP